MRVLLVVALSAALVGCDALAGLIEPQWQVENANGDNGALHFGVNPWALKIGDIDRIRVERVEHRSIKRQGGNDKEEERTRKVRILTVRCESKSICSAAPHDSDTRDIVVTPRMMGSTKVYVSASIDEEDVVKDSITVTVAP